MARSRSRPPILRRGAPAVLLGTLVALGPLGCAQQREVSSVDDTPPPQQVRGEIGEPFDLMEVETTVLDLEPYDVSPNGFPRLALSMRSENTTFRPLRNPDAELVCDEVPDGGEWWAGSTWEANGLLGPGEVNEGIVYIGFPSLEGDSEYPIPTCTNARAVLTATDVSDRSSIQLVFPVDASLIDEAIDAPTGRPLPLPPAPGGPVGPGQNQGDEGG